jgi:TNF receptor-associated protein 1
MKAGFDEQNFMSTTEKHHFQAEIQQLLNIVIHSLYTDREIFIRELISNASDACEKLRFLQSSGTAVYQPEVALGITVTTDESARTITFTDTGVGMTHAELIENLGTIAHSGSKAFLKEIGKEKKPDANLIGQFGVGFYSAFMVAGKVTVFSRSHRPEETGWKWTSDGSGGYEIEPATDLPRGTKMVLDLKEEAKEFAEAATVERIIKRYSNFVQFPIALNDKTLNTVGAIWARNKSDIKEEEYDEFYRYIGHDQDKPMYRLHFSADAPLAIQALLFVPARNVETMGIGRGEPEVNLYCRKILIQAKAKGLFPEWLRFLRGVVDSEDFPLNISRETMQDSALLQKLNKVLTGRFIKFLDEQSQKDAAAYNKFFDEFGRFIKEGIVTDWSHREALGKLLRYESSTLAKGEKTSLAEYVKRMQAEQKEIYYLLAPSREAAEASAYYEVFKAKNLEVLFFTDPWDEFVMENLHSFDGKNLQAAEKADVKLGDVEKKDETLTPEAATELAKWAKEVLGDKVNEVRSSERLVDSPAVVVDSDKFITATMRQMLRAMKKEEGAGFGGKVDLELNPRHKLIVHLDKLRQSNAELAAKVAEQLLDNGRVAAGLLEDPRAMLKRLNELLEQVVVKS